MIKGIKQRQGKLKWPWLEYEKYSDGEKILLLAFYRQRISRK
jgi:hypothetical protein